MEDAECPPGCLGNRKRTNRTARLVLAAFLFTFMAARVIVFLIMTERIPSLYMYSHGIHVHHLNYGIFLLSTVGGWLVFGRPYGRALSVAAVFYGIGLGLTFDEFGMWLHLEDNYWQWASFGAVVVVAALLTLIAYARTLERFRPHHWTTAALLAVVLVAFGYVLWESMHLAHRVWPMFEHLQK